MKKILSLSLFSIYLFLISFEILKAEEKHFVVTAYYSPLPWQQYYMRWNLEKEKILQWNWTHWASWKKVFSWMLAAPKNYDFWTKIYLEWLWVWVVEDRGQAIVKKWERWYNHDRLDVWMWYGDEWLKRTLAWWKRKIKWKVLEEKTDVTINYKNHPAPDSAILHLKKQEKTIFDFGIWKDSNKEDIIKLQEFLKEKWFYNWKIDGIYNSEIIDIVLKFQIENNILNSEIDFWAWYWWEKTRKLFKEKNLNINKEEKKVDIKNDNNINKNIFSSFENKEEEIKEVEKILKEISFIWKDVSLNSKNFSENILKFQIEKNIISSKNDIWAWNFWPKTRNTLKNIYESYKDKKIFEEIKVFENNFKMQKLEIESEDLADKKIKKLKNKIIKKWETSEDVRLLQEILLELWYFSDKATSFYGEKTFNSVVNFQIENNLIKNKNDKLAWLVSKDTILKLKSNLQKKYLDEILNKK